MDAASCQSQVLISRDAILHNVRTLRGYLAPETRICAMVKADAYGHGAALVADTLCNFSSDLVEAPAVDALAVAGVEEAAELPPQPQTMLIMRPIGRQFVARQRQAIEHAIAHRWVLTLSEITAAGDVARIASRMERRALVQIMVDTGMTRCGVQPAQFAELVGRVAAAPELSLWGLCTHFACAENDPAGLTVAQLQEFTRLADEVAAEHALRGRPLVRHAANSAASFLHPGSHLDMVRPGISLYGIDRKAGPTCHAYCALL